MKSVFAVLLVFCGLFCVLILGIASSGGKSDDYIPLEKGAAIQKAKVNKYAPARP